MLPCSSLLYREKGFGFTGGKQTRQVMESSWPQEVPRKSGQAVRQNVVGFLLYHKVDLLGASKA